MDGPESYIGKRVRAVVPGTSAGDVRFPPGVVVGLRTSMTIYAVRKGRKIPEQTEALIFTVKLDAPFRSPLTEGEIRGLLVNIRVPELLDDEFAGRTGPKGSKVLVTALLDPALLEKPEEEADMDEKNSDHYGPGYLEPA